MSTKLIVGIIAIVAIGILVFYIRNRKSKSSVKPSENTEKSKSDTSKE